MALSRNNSASAAVVAKLRQEIESGNLSPGHRLPPQSGMAKQYSVGMSTIREAINALEVMGYLEVRQGSGTFVRQNQPLNDSVCQRLEQELKEANVLEIYELREILEVHAAKLAAIQADDASLDQVEAKVQALASSTSERQIYLKADFEFHLAVAQASGQQVLSVFLRLMYDLMHRHFPLAHATLIPEYREKSVETAQNLVKALRQGEQSVAARCMRSHMGLALRALRKSLQPNAD